MIEEIGKATDGKNFFPLREMHGLQAAGKCIGFNFNDADKEISMTFKVIDDDAWKKVEERVYTGFSQGGRKVGDQVPDPVHKGCMRYVADPSEVSLVDNPCLAAAHFAYVKADGVVEMRKFLKVEDPPELRITALEAEVSLLKTAAATKIDPPAPTEEPKGITKRIGDKDLLAANFAYVGNTEKTDSWKFPIHNKAYTRDSLLRFNQGKDVPHSEKANIKAKIVAAAKTFGIDVPSEVEKINAIGDLLRRMGRIYVNQNFAKINNPHVLSLDSDLGKLKLAKGMYEVSRLASTLDCLESLIFSVCCEQEWEADDASKVPALLAANIAELGKTFLEMVDEETRELIEQANKHAKV